MSVIPAIFRKDWKNTTVAERHLWLNTSRLKLLKLKSIVYVVKRNIRFYILASLGQNLIWPKSNIRKT